MGCSDPKPGIIHHASSLLLTPHFRSSWHPPPRCTLGTGRVLPPLPPPPSLQGCHSARGPVPLLPPLPLGDRPQELLWDSWNPGRSCYCRVCGYHSLCVLGQTPEALPSPRSQCALRLPVFFNAFIFGCAGPSLLPVWAFSTCSRLGLLSGCGAWASHSSGFSCFRTRALVVVARGLSCSSARGIFPDQGSNPCPLHWQVAS